MKLRHMTAEVVELEDVVIEEKSSWQDDLSCL